MMTKQQPLVLTITIVLSSILITACVGSKTKQQEPPSGTQTNPSGAQEGQSNTNIPPQNNPPPTNPVNSATFHPIGGALVQASTASLSNHATTSDGFTIAALSEQDRAAIKRAFDNTNQLRRNAGKPELQYDERLGAYAQHRSQEIVQKFSHERPDNTSFSSGFEGGYGAVGENIAAGQASPDKTVLEQWRNSAGHYANIISDNYKRIGIGLVRAPNSRYGYYWTQIFAGGNRQTPYHFGTVHQGNRDTGMANHLGQFITIDHGKIKLIGGQATRNNASIAAHYGQLTHGIYAKTKQFNYNGFRALIQDPQGSGFSYQTFGEIVDKNNVPVQYVNIGQPTIPKDNSQFHAIYHGASLGNIDRKSHFYADVTAVVDYGPQRKTMDISFSNTQFAKDDIKDNNTGKNVQGLGLPGNINFTERLEWNRAENRFTHDRNDSHIHASFYGPQGEEIGGQFSRPVWLGQYEGVFGARRAEVKP